MRLEIDLSKVSDDELENLAAWFGRVELDFQEEVCEFEEFFQQLTDILRSEKMMRSIGMGSKGAQSFELVKREAFYHSGLKAVENIAIKLANDERSRSVFGGALLKAVMGS